MPDISLRRITCLVETLKSDLGVALGQWKSKQRRVHFRTSVACCILYAARSRPTSMFLKAVVLKFVAMRTFIRSLFMSNVSHLSDLPPIVCSHCPAFQRTSMANFSALLVASSCSLRFRSDLATSRNPSLHSLPIARIQDREHSASACSSRSNRPVPAALLPFLFLSRPVENLIGELAEPRSLHVPPKTKQHSGRIRHQVSRSVRTIRSRLADFVGVL